jgi:antitoxin component of MazEF toxin-antitoxin module
MRVKPTPVGDDAFVPIDPWLLKRLGIDADTSLEVTVEHGRIVITPVRQAPGRTGERDTPK